MIDLMFLIYLIDLLSTINKTAPCLIFGLIVFGVMSPLATEHIKDALGIKTRDEFNQFIKPYIKRYVLVLSILSSVNTLIPSERTMYIMAGLYTGDKVLDVVSQSETFQKAEQLLNKKLDEELGDHEK